MTRQTHEAPEAPSISGTGESPTGRWAKAGAHGCGPVPLRVFPSGDTERGRGPGCLTVPPNKEMGDDLVGGLVRWMHLTRGSLRQGNTTSCTDDRHHGLRRTDGPVSNAEEADDSPALATTKGKLCRPSPSYGSGDNHDVGFGRSSRSINRRCMGCSGSGKGQSRDHNQQRPDLRLRLNLSCHPPNCSGPCATIRLPAVHWIDRPTHSCPTILRARPSPGTGSESTKKGTPLP